MLDFRELVKALSVLCRGTAESKLAMVAAFFDVAETGSVSKSQLSSMLGALAQVSVLLPSRLDAALTPFRVCFTWGSDG